MNRSENQLLATYKDSGGELSESVPTGLSWTAKDDGEYYPVKGSYDADSVSLKRINDRTIELSFKANGTVVRVNTITISSDGKIMTIVSESKASGRVSNMGGDEAIVRRRGDSRHSIGTGVLPDNCCEQGFIST
jgi:hypothetical protein